MGARVLAIGASAAPALEDRRMSALCYWDIGFERRAWTLFQTVRWLQTDVAVS